MLDKELSFSIYFQDKTCTTKKDFECGRGIHANYSAKCLRLISYRYESFNDINSYLINTIIAVVPDWK